MRLRRKLTQEWYTFSVIPFLAIMLGMISIMSTTTIAISWQKHRQVQRSDVVKLANIPPTLIPLHIRVGKRFFAWYGLNKEERTVPIQEIQGLPFPDITELKKFCDFVNDVVKENQKVSFSGKQYTFILWCEPEGALNALQLLEILDEIKSPIRVGMLPILPGEKIKFE